MYSQCGTNTIYIEKVSAKFDVYNTYMNWVTIGYSEEFWIILYIG